MGSTLHSRTRNLSWVITIIAIAWSAFVPTLASADPIFPQPGYMNTTAYPSFITSAYKGWGYVSNNGSATVYKWSATGWLSAQFTPGTSAWIHPFSGDWSWAYRGGTWYAIKSRSVASWSCTGSNMTAAVVGKTPTYRYNTSQSDLQGYLAPGTRVALSCENYFADASIGWGTAFITAPEGYALIKASPQPGCTIPTEPGGIICMIAIMPTSPRPVYILAKDLLF